MARRRFFVDLVQDGRAEMCNGDAHHLVRVLRAETGQQYEICDNRSVYLAEIEAVEKDRVRFRVIQELEASETGPHFTLFAALFKFDRFEWMLEKATELGVERIAPVVAERSEKGLDRAAEKRAERWRKILLESSQQSRRVRIPEIGCPEKLSNVLRADADWRCFLDEKPGVPALVSAIPEKRSQADSVSILVGPEGGWTEAERSQIVAAGWSPVSLGPRILRAETAAITGLAVMGSVWPSD